MVAFADGGSTQIAQIEFKTFSNSKVLWQMLGRRSKDPHQKRKTIVQVHVIDLDTTFPALKKGNT